MRPRVGISACLLGDAVRYDGGDKLCAAVLEHVAPRVELIGVCPEVEIGLGVPRPRIQLARSSDRAGPPRLVEVIEGRDHTERMAMYAEVRVAALVALGLSGYVLKSRSPSCGARGVPVAGSAETAPGAFAAVLRRRLPGLPVVEETDLVDAAACAAFLRAVVAYASA